MNARYTVILEPGTEDCRYVASVPALPGCVTEGATFEEAVANAEEAVAGYLEALAKLGEPIPIEGPPEQGPSRWRQAGSIAVHVDDRDDV